MELLQEDKLGIEIDSLGVAYLISRKIVREDGVIKVLENHRQEATDEDIAELKGRRNGDN